MTTTFYAPPEAFQGAHVTLPGDEAHHAVRVLRHRPGDELVVIDGVGGRHRVRLEEAGKRAAWGTVLATEAEVGEPDYRLRLGLALLKNRSRFETVVEKAVELGVAELVPLVTDRTEKVGLKRQRLDNIVLAATKQCGRSRLMTVSGPLVLDRALDEPSDLTILCHEQTATSARFLDVLAAHPAAQRLTVLIGPEGGFTSDEVDAAVAAGAHPASLGARRLRAETAALAACAGVALQRSGAAPQPG